MENLSEIEYWTLSEFVNEGARKAIDSRVSHEMKISKDGPSIKDVHSEVLRDYDDIKKIILGAFSIINRLGISYAGDAADLGSGTGIGATILSTVQEITKIYAIEYSEEFVQKMMPVVFSDFGAKAEKIIRVVGDFNNLKLKDSSLMVLLEIHSFHHSENLEYTLKECYRVLKPGGLIIAIDRAWPDSCSREELEIKLDVEYSDKSKAVFGIPPGESYRRRDNGEHEYTISDWLTYYKKSGFDPFVFSQIHLPKLNSIFIKIVSGFKISLFLSGLMSKLGFRRLFLYGFNPTRKLFIAIKR